MSSKLSSKTKNSDQTISVQHRKIPETGIYSLVTKPEKTHLQHLTGVFGKNDYMLKHQFVFANYRCREKYALY